VQAGKHENKDIIKLLRNSCLNNQFFYIFAALSCERKFDDSKISVWKERTLINVCPGWAEPMNRKDLPESHQHQAQKRSYGKLVFHKPDRKVRCLKRKDSPHGREVILKTGILSLNHLHPLTAGHSDLKAATHPGNHPIPGDRLLTDLMIRMRVVPDHTALAGQKAIIRDTGLTDHTTAPEEMMTDQVTKDPECRIIPVSTETDRQESPNLDPA
jgi:hypothetical protein